MNGFLYGFLGLSLALSISGVYAAFGLLLLAGVVEAVRTPGRVRWKPFPFDGPVLIYVGWGVLVTIVAGSTSLRKAVSAHSAFFLFLFLIHVSRKDDLQGLVRWFAVGTVLAAAWGALQVSSGINHIPGLQTTSVPDFWSHWPKKVVGWLAVRDGRPIGSRSHPLTYAESFIPAYFLSAGLLFGFVRDRVGKGWATHRWSILLAASAFGILIAQGRAVWLGTLVGTFFLFPILPKKERWAAGGILASCVALLFLVSPSLRSRALSTFSSHEGTTADQYSKSTRFELWRQIPELVRENPLVGKGLNGVSIDLPWEPGGVKRTWTELHNIFFQHAAERGLVGFGLLIWLLVMLAAMIIRLPGSGKWIAAGGLAAFLIAGLTESWMNDAEIAFLFWSMAALAAREGS